MQLFTKEELRDLAISVLAATVIFSFIPFSAANPGIDYKMFPYYLIIIIITFVFHELAHKFIARRFGCASIYKMWPQGIFFGLLLMMVGLKFVAPGAVMVYPYTFSRWGYRARRLGVNESGIISLVGPATNLLFAMVFSLFGGWFFGLLTFVNAWIAFINLLPFPPLDGSKILEWRIWVWGLMIALAGLLVAPYLF